MIRIIIINVCVSIRIFVKTPRLLYVNYTLRNTYTPKGFAIYVHVCVYIVLNGLPSTG